MHLLAAQANFAARAEVCEDALYAVLRGEMLLDKYDFDGTGEYLRPENPDYHDALEIAETLDRYNNGMLCIYEPVDQRPIVIITDPADGSPVEGTVLVEAIAADDIGVDQVEFLVDGTSIGTDTDSSDGWSVSWDTATVDSGSHILTTVATDTGGQAASDDIVVIVADGLGPMYVVDLQAVASLVQADKWNVEVTIMVWDETDAPVVGATVYGTFSGQWSQQGKPAAEACTTDGTGQCSIAKTGIHKKAELAKFSVDDVTAVGYYYEPEEDDYIIVYKPQE
jgi:hypothetical protein